MYKARRCLSDFTDLQFGVTGSDYFRWRYEESSGYLINTKTGGLLTHSSGSIVLSHSLADSGPDETQQWRLDYNVGDVLVTEDSCYQSLPSDPGAGMTYEAAAEICQSELDGAVVSAESLANVTELPGLLASLLSDSDPEADCSWWLAAADDGRCSRVSAAGVTEEDCEGSGRALCQLGLQCRPDRLELVGPEQCLCGCQDFVAQPTLQDCQLCREGEFCYEDVTSHYCVQQCDQLPVMNSAPCFCHSQVCDSSGMNYCNLTGCQYFDSCPLSPYNEFLSNETLCDCWEGGLCNITQYCSVDTTTTTTTTTTNSVLVNTEFDMNYNYNTGPVTQCLARPDICPELPSLSPPGGCTCNSSALCAEGLMCDPANTSSPCTERPPPCLAFPASAGPGGCFCDLAGVTDTPEICEEREACAASCFLPAYCEDPQTAANWSSYNAVVTSQVRQSVIQGTELEVECLQHTFSSLGLRAGEYREVFTALCTEEGSWTLEPCEHPACPQPQVDTASVEVTELLTTLNASSQGTVLKFSCKEEHTEFDFVSATRVLARCNRR